MYSIQEVKKKSQNPFIRKNGLPVHDNPMLGIKFCEFTSSYDLQTLISFNFGRAAPYTTRFERYSISDQDICNLIHFKFHSMYISDFTHFLYLVLYHLVSLLERKSEMLKQIPVVVSKIMQIYIYIYIYVTLAV